MLKVLTLLALSLMTCQFLYIYFDADVVKRLFPAKEPIVVPSDGSATFTSFGTKCVRVGLG